MYYKVKKREVDNIFETFLDLENVKTKTLEKDVFDDSVTDEKTGFSFMEVNEVYDCKILLSLYTLNENGEKYTLLHSIKIANQELYEIENTSGDQYYIRPNDDDGKTVVFKEGNAVTISKDSYRKDLIQVDGVLHPDF
ncbi:hypothetical protein Q2T76_03005 [Lactobacillus sp. YT155]|uniref:hypothetical protein n=1 Tax=Lactobacillus sp. YT155 TaxID=3060955 RepID=UPI00265F927B|nr:hypothetical protein [Lactobacillus sp. YT155]MDO1605021.1 hypothetical protein [Lactobacillus sp. YT155]